MSVNQRFKKLFSSLEISGLEIRNRIVMPAFGLKYCGIDRKPNQRLIDFYLARAKGGCGLIVIGGVGIDLEGSGLMLPSIESDEFIPAWKKLADALRPHGARLFLQLFHAGRYQHSMLARGAKAVAPSAVPSRYTSEEPRALELEEIPELQDKFAAAAVRAKEAGIDGVEIIGSAGYLICQFLSPVTNLRADEYGGALENRTRFGREVIEKVRAAVGPDYPVGMRVAGNDFVPGGNANAQLIEAYRIFASAGVDLFNVTGGWHETLVPQLPSMVPRGAYAYLAANIRREIDVPVVASNRIVEPAQAEAILQDTLVDMVTIGRSQIADPEWANKARAGRATGIRPCVGCMQGCLDRLFSMRDVECLCNPVAGHEGERQLSPAGEPKRVVVAGGGPAGLEAALTASRRGHEVVLLEKGDEIGGQLPLVAAPPGREEFGSLMRYYREAIAGSGVELRLRVEATPEMIKELKPDVVLVAAGSSQLVPAIPGVDRPEVVTAWDVLLRRAEVGRTVAVLGGGAVGVETAIAVAERGSVSGEGLRFLLKHEAEDYETLKRLATRGVREVTILEKLSKIGKDIGPTTKWVLLKELELLGVSTQVKAEVTAITDAGVEYMWGEEAQTLKVDTVVLALGSRPNEELVRALEEASIKCITMGDVKKPRKIMDAVHEGFLTALEI